MDNIKKAQKLAEIVLSIPMFTGKWLTARKLASEILGIPFVDTPPVKKRPILQPKRCAFPGCEATEGVKRIDIQINWFRGDDVVLNACKEHRQKKYESELLKAENTKTHCCPH